jgi:nucleotide-binding universal stress UspA family protein
VATSGHIVLVGLDNTRGARAALRWAVRYASRVGGVVRAVHAFELPGRPAARLEADPDGARAAVQDHAQAWVADALDGLPPRRAAIIVEVRDGAAPIVLSRAARRANVLALGLNRDRLAGPRRPKVLDRCALSPDCQVVVVDEVGRVSYPDPTRVESS